MSVFVPSPIKWHGGKYYIATKIVRLMPPHTHYVEPFFGSGAVLFAKDFEGVSEAVNDLDCILMNFWGCLANPEYFDALARTLEAAPFAQPLWEASMAVLETAQRMGQAGASSLSPAASVQLAVAFFVACRQSLAGRMKSFAPFSKTRTRRGMNEQCSAWWSAIEGLSGVHARLQRVGLLCDAYGKVLASEDDEQTLFYLDPPYLPEERVAKKVFQYEMAREEHKELLERILSLRGKVMLSGYRSELYDHRLASWARHEFTLPNNAAGGETKRRMTECVWCNFATGPTVP